MRATRNRALPLIISSYASTERSSGKISFIDLTPDRALKDSVSCESIDEPLYQPIIDRRPESRGSRGTSSGSLGAPMTMSFPLTARSSKSCSRTAVTDPARSEPLRDCSQIEILFSKEWPYDKTM